VRATISIHAAVLCRDREAGRSKEVIVDPKRRRLTHIIVREDGLTDSERIVPFDLIRTSSEDAIRLRSTRDQLDCLENYLDAHFVEPTYETPLPVDGAEAPPPDPLVISKRIPEGEVSLGRWALVEGTDGPVGRVRSLLVDMEDAHITHVVVLTHHFLSRREVAVPVEEVEHFHSEYVPLRVSRRAIESLPHVPLHHASVVPDIGAAAEDLVPEDPADPRVAAASDASHVEGAHLLADEVRTRLRARGFTDEQILDWAKAFLRAKHAGGDVDFLDWIRRQEHISKVR
jgi:hypothetical protein